MEENTISEQKDGDVVNAVVEAPSIAEESKQKDLVTKKRRRGKSKRKIMKPFLKVPWQDRRKNEKTKRNYRFRKMVLSKTHAPFNNNQFLMEIHKPEPDGNFQILQTPSARTRDSSFSVDSDDNYFYSLPEDEEEYLTKEFSSVYEDAQSERLSNMTKDDLVQEYLLLEAKYDNLVKRTERNKPKSNESMDGDASLTDRDSMVTDRDTSGTSTESQTVEEPSLEFIMQRLKEQEEHIRELELANEKLRDENEHLRQQSMASSSEDSESDSSSTSGSSSSTNRSHSPTAQTNGDIADPIPNGHHDLVNGDIDAEESELSAENIAPSVENGFHNSTDTGLTNGSC